VFGDGINLVEGATSIGECACNLVHETDAGETSTKGLVIETGEVERGTRLLPTIVPCALPTATSSPTMRNLTRSDLSG
jgi:hypothetical protein